MEHDILFGNSNRGNGTTFLDFPLFLGIFQWDEPTKRVPFTAEPEISEILTKWKAPIIWCIVEYSNSADVRVSEPLSFMIFVVSLRSWWDSLHVAVIPTGSESELKIINIYHHPQYV